MKNLFVLTEEEKNRILGLHESATKNHYLINEQSSQSVIDKIKDSSLWNKYFNKNWKEVASTEKLYSVNIDVAEPQNIAVSINFNDDFNSGNLSFLYPRIFSLTDDTSDVKSREGGTWSYKNGYFTGSIDGQSFSKQSLQEAIYHLLKFFYPMSMQYYSRKADLSTTQPTEPQSNKGTFTWEQAVAKWPCLYNQKDKTIYNNGSYDYVKYDWKGMEFYVFIGDGHLFDPRSKTFTGKYLVKDIPCDSPDLQLKREPVVGGGQKNPNVERIKDLQRKVGVKDDGILGKQTLKAIMDKLTK